MKKAAIKYDKPGRLRFRLGQYAFDKKSAYNAEAYIKTLDFVEDARVKHQNGSILIEFDERFRQDLLKKVNNIHRRELPDVPYGNDYLRHEITTKLEVSLVKKLFFKYVASQFLPYSLFKAMVIGKTIPMIITGLKALSRRNVNVDVLDATAVTASLLQRDFETANSIMFLLSISSLLEEYATARAKVDLSDSLSINVSNVWKVTDIDKNHCQLIPFDELKVDDMITVKTGNTIPIDGKVVRGIAEIDESSMTGESMASEKTEGSSVYAGTVVSNGDLIIRVTQLSKDTRINKIIDMIDTSEDAKAGVQSHAEILADKLVPFSLLGSVAAFALTGNITKAMSVLMVDYSCAIKLTTPIAIISAIREASNYGIMVKGGRHLENFSQADAIVFDKTGTLTISCPTVTDVIAFEPYDRDEVLRISACIEEHFPHSVAKAIVKKAKDEGLKHEEKHAEVKYVLAHGIRTTIDDVNVIIGSRHFVFEDEKYTTTEEQERIMDELSDNKSMIYLGIAGKLAGIICIDDPPRPEAKGALQELRDVGFKTQYMITGDGPKAAKHISKAVGIDQYYYHILPDQKANIIKKLKTKHRKIVMVGDGVNDTPSLAAADVSVTMSDASDIAREVSDIVLVDNNLRELAEVKRLSDRLMRRIKRNYGVIIGFNSTLLGLGLMGIIMPTTSALLHNASTLGISLYSTRKLVKKEV